MATQLSIYNGALLHLKASVLSSLSENRESRRVLDALWTDVRKQMLEAGFWKFAMRTVSITQDTAVTPAFGPAYAHNFPDDWVKTYIVSANESLDPPLEYWLEESNLLFADVTPLYLRYVSNATSGYGFDPDRWTARFIEAFEFKLAARACGKIQGAGNDSRDALVKDAAMSLNSALSFEALREPSKRQLSGNWNNSRFSRNSGRWSGGYRVR